MCSMINIVCADLQLGMLVTQVAPSLRWLLYSGSIEYRLKLIL